MSNNLVQNNNLYRVFTYPNIFSAEECQKIINLPGIDLPIPVYSEVENDSINPNLYPYCRGIKVDENTSWIYNKLDKVIQHANKNFFNFDIIGIGDSRLNEYKDGRFFDWHVDFGNGASSTRKITAVLMLSNQEEFEGGELKWWGINHDLQQKQGTVVLFPPYILHRVEPVTKGVRYTLISWVHGPHFR